MENIVVLLRRDLLTQKQAVFAAKFRANPYAFKLAPISFGFLHDVICKEMSMEEIERQRGMPSRSAKAVLSHLLYAMEEMHGMWWDDRIGDESFEDAVEANKFLTGDDITQIADLQLKYGLAAGIEGRVFLVLHGAAGPISRETLHRRIYGHLPPGDVPQEKNLDVFITRIRAKIRNDWVIQNIRGLGFVMKAVPKAEAAE